MNQTRKLIGGSFAPPLTVEKMTAYKSLAESCDDRKCKGYMNDLIKMVDVFFETPESCEKAVKHPAGVGMMVPLEEAEVERIWDCVPWSEECDLIGQALDVLDKEAARKNSDAITRWNMAVCDHIISKHFIDPTNFSKIASAVRRIGELIGVLEDKEIERLKKKKEKLDSLDHEISLAITTRSYEGIPYPELIPTPHRSAAYHLLWYARELTKDREPCTCDKL